MEQWYKDGNIFNSQQSLRLGNKGSSLPHFLGEGNIEVPVVVGENLDGTPIIDMKVYIKVVEGVKPTPTTVQYLQEAPVALVNGVPTTQWNVVDMFADTAQYTDMNGVVIPAKTKLQYETEYLAKLQADAMAQVVQHFTDTTTAYIEGKVQEYNTANGLAFKDIDAFTKYAVTPTSVHNAIAIRFIGYADRLWSAVRIYQATATSTPTDIEFKAILDGVVF